jgi:hypothetical protein
MTVINWSSLRAIRIHNRGGGNGVRSSDPKPLPPSPLPGDGTPETPGP